ncbi:YcjF family protein [Aidingimonas lacisalsi]|uniref:YcjF family protein n=1 Tax=Aidingimonas lacisalsi TaxID=2604086 RepID=UPI0011D1C394|nr:TIGR01620 family protein [Aidingimonas lacisalsi]
MNDTRHDSPRPGRQFTVDNDIDPDDASDPRPAEAFDTGLTTRPLADDDPESESEAAIADSLARPRRKRWGLATLLGGSLLLGGIEFVQRLYSAVLVSDWNGGAWSLLGMLALGLGGTAMLREIGKLRRLRRHAQLRQRLAALDTCSPQDASQLADMLRRQLGLDDDHPHWQAFSQSHRPHHSGDETRRLLAHHLLAPRDREARRLISRMSGDTAIMVAVSPLTLVDMALVAWRNLALIDRLARLYGLELGYASRLRLFRAVLHNMAFAGASEMASEASMELLSMNVAGRLSARAGQGLGVGLLSARLGIKCLALSRPLPFDDGECPRISDLRRELWRQLRQMEHTDYRHDSRST